MCKSMDKKISSVLFFAVGLALGVGGFYLFQANGIVSSEKAGKISIDFINKAIAEQNVAASLVNVATESGVYKLHLKIADKEYDSFVTKDGKYLFSTAFNLEEETVKESVESVQETPDSYDISFLENLAKCLTEKGVKFYGASWCGHCKNQKEMFGQAAEFLPYIECSTPDGNDQTAVCKENNITGYPTWVFADGTKESGELSLQKLSEKTGCPLPQ